MTGATSSSGDNLAAIAEHEFAVLTTYRRDGTPVPTTIWFANDDGRVYITTRQEAGKLKRIRRDGRVLLEPSDRVGNLLGAGAVTAQAREAASEERPYALAALAAKYGEQWTRIVGDGGDDPARAYIVVE